MIAGIPYVICHMKHAYLILAHTNPEQIKILVDSLYLCQSTSFFIHIDAKSRIEKELRTLLGKRANVCFVPEPVNVHWGGFSQIEATLKLLRLAYSFCEGQSNVYFHLISGMDFPIKPNDVIHDFFRENYGTQYIEYNPLPYNGWSNNGGIDRVKYNWFMDDMQPEETYKLYLAQKQLDIVNRNYSERRRYYGGSQWWSITIDCARYILLRIKNRKLIERFKLVYCSDEIFFHTLIVGSGKFEVTNTNLRYIDWVSGPDFPKRLNMEDIDKIEQSDCLFARKIDARRTPGLIAYFVDKNK